MIEGRELSHKNLQIDSLDGLRGLAVLIVFLSHSSNRGADLLPYADFRGIGKSGVFLFFALSSFLLTLPFLERGRPAFHRSSILNYAARRFFRIYPLYLAFLSVGLLAACLQSVIASNAQRPFYPFSLSVGDFIAHLALLEGKGVTWSIVVEFRYYFLLPIIALIHAVVLENKVIRSSVLTLVLIIVSQILWPHIRPNDLRLGPYLPIFFLGALLAVFFHRWQRSRFVASRTSELALAAAGWLAVALLIATIPSVYSLISGHLVSPRYFHQQPVLIGVLWSIVLFASVVGRGALRRFFELPPLRYLGFISFSVYLWHFVVIDYVIRIGVPSSLRGGVALAATIAVSHVTWMLIEKPTSRIGAVPRTDASPPEGGVVSSAGTAD